MADVLALDREEIKKIPLNELLGAPHLGRMLAKMEEAIPFGAAGAIRRQMARIKS